MAKYIIDVPDNYLIKSALNGLTLGIPMLISATQKEYVLPTNIQLNQYTEPDRETIENEVWDLAQKLCEMNQDQWVSCFGADERFKTPSDYNYQEAKAKYDEWAKEKSRIRVGDEVEIVNIIGVVIRVPKHDEQRVHYITKSGTVYCNNAYAEIKKTGRHFDEIEELLKKMSDKDD